jgi:hypothetical protein
MSGKEAVSFSTIGRVVDDAAGQRTATEDQLVHLVMELGVVHYEKRVRHQPTGL